MALYDESPSTELKTSRNHFVRPHYLAWDSLSNVLNFYLAFYQVIYKGLVLVKGYPDIFTNFIHHETKKRMIEILLELNDYLTD